MNDRAKLSSASQSWHVGSWPPLAWLETALKGVAIAVGLIGLGQTILFGQFAWPAGIGLVQPIILIILSLGLLAAILDRVIEREVISMIFVIFNNLAHWAMVATLLALPASGGLLLLFCGLMLAGDLVKLRFLVAHNFTVREVSLAALLQLTTAYAVGYGLILILELVG